MRARITVPCIGLRREPPLRITRRCHPPNHVADVVRHKQCSEIGYGNADRTTKRFAVFIEETGQDISRLPGGTPIGEWHKNHLMSAFRYAVQEPYCPMKTPFRYLSGVDSLRRMSIPGGAVWLPSA